MENPAVFLYNSYKKSDKSFGVVSHPNIKDVQIRFMKCLDELYFNVDDFLKTHPKEKVEEYKKNIGLCLPIGWNNFEKLWMSTKAWEILSDSLSSVEKKREALIKALEEADKNG